MTDEEVTEGIPGWIKIFMAVFLLAIIIAVVVLKMNTIDEQRTAVEKNNAGSA